MAGNHWLFIGVFPGSHGTKAGISGTSFRAGWELQLILFWIGPRPLSIFGLEEGGLWFRSSRRSALSRGVVPLEGSLDRGGISFSDLVGVLSGNFIGEMVRLGLLCSLTLSPEGPDFIAFEDLSFLAIC